MFVIWTREKVDAVAVITSARLIASVSPEDAAQRNGVTLARSQLVTLPEKSLLFISRTGKLLISQSLLHTSLIE